MTVVTTESYVTYVGNGSTKVFPYSFMIQTGAAVVTVWSEATGSVILSPSQYTISGLNNPVGGSVTYPKTGAAISGAYSITIERRLSPIQGMDISPQTNFYPNSIEDALDYLTYLVQQSNFDSDRAVLLPTGYPGTAEDLIQSIFDASASAAAADLGQVTPQQYGGIGNGVADDTAAINSAKAAAISTGKTLFFPTGTYNFSTLDFATTKLQIEFASGVVLKHIGVGVAITFDGTANIYSTCLVSFGWGCPPTIQGNINTTTLVWVQDVSQSRFDVILRDCVTGFRLSSSICDQIRIHQSAAIGAFSVLVPTNTLIIDTTLGPTQFCQDHDIQIISENVSGFGIIVTAGNLCVFRGTSEANGGGVVVSSPCYGNEFICFDCESNPDGDILDNGYCTSLTSCAMIDVRLGGRAAVAHGGYLKNLTVSGENATFNNVQIEGTITDTGFGTKFINCIGVSETGITSDVYLFNNANVILTSTIRTVLNTGSMTAPRTITLPPIYRYHTGDTLLIVDLAGTVTGVNTITVILGSGTFSDGTTSKVLNAARAGLEIVMYPAGSIAWFKAL